MNTTTKTILAAILLTGMSISASAQEEEKGNGKTEFSIEIDPATFFFSGYALHLRIKPKNSEHLFLGAGIYAMDFPDLLVDLNENNKEMGWNVRLNQGIGLFGEYHFSEVNNRWFVGTQLAIQEYKIEKDKEIGSEKYQTFLGLGYGGYTFPVFKESGLYIKPWMGIGYTTKIDGENKLGSSEYDISPVLLFAAVHLGYTF